MTATLTHRRATLPSTGTSPRLVVHVTTRDHVSQPLADLLKLLEIPLPASDLLEHERHRFLTEHLGATADLGCVVASLSEIRDDVSAELHDELAWVAAETDLMMWAALTPGVTWHDVAGAGSDLLAVTPLADAAGRAHLVNAVLALLRGWLTRTTGKTAATR